MVKGAIFDLDGTLIDSMFIWDTVGNDYLKSLGLEPKENLSKVFNTFTLLQAAEYYRNHYDIELSAREIMDGINKMISEMYQEKVELKPGVKDFLRRLQSLGVKMCVATVTDRAIADAVLKRLHVREYFSEIFTCEEVGFNKESPEIYRRAQNFLGTEKAETVVFEDAFHALKTAKDDGFPVAAVYDVHEPKQKEMKEISDYYITDFGCFCFKTKMKTALSIAGVDSSGGAGVLADVKTMTLNGVYAMSVVTALTAQNTLGVRSISTVTPSFLREQMDAVFEDIFPDSVKIGMVASGELIEVIAERLKYYNAKNIVVDPVMVSTSGSSLMQTDAVKVLCEKLLPIATLVTPNIPEAEVLTGIKIVGREDMEKAAGIIGETYGCSVLLKGGHSIQDASDILYQKGEYTWFCGRRVDNPNTHGTGCTLSSAIAAGLAKGNTLIFSVQKAKEYITDALYFGLDLGKGSGPLNHGFCINHNKS